MRRRTQEARCALALAHTRTPPPPPEPSALDPGPTRTPVASTLAARFALARALARALALALATNRAPSTFARHARPHLSPDTMAVHLDVMDPAARNDMLLKSAATSLSSKLVSGHKEFFAKMVVDAVNQVRPLHSANTQPDPNPEPDPRPNPNPAQL